MLDVLCIERRIKMTIDQTLIVKLSDSIDILKANNKDGLPANIETLQEISLDPVGLHCDISSVNIYGENVISKPNLTLLQLHKELEDDEKGLTNTSKEFPFIPKLESKKILTEEKNIENFNKTKTPRIEPVHVIEKVNDELTVRFSSIVWDKIRTWTEMTTEEISGLGCVKREANGIFFVYDVFLVKQENTGSFTDIDDEALHALMWELETLDDTDNGNRLDDLRFWWHSHANMGVFWSGQDDHCIKTKMAHASWWLSVVVNKPGKIKTRLDIQNPPMRFDDIKCDIHHEVAEHIKQECQKEFDKKVIKKTYNYNNYNKLQHETNTWLEYYNKKHNIKTALECLPTKTEQQNSWEQLQKLSPKLITDNWGLITEPDITTGIKISRSTPFRAQQVYEEEINLAKDWLIDKAEELKLGESHVIGFAFYPRYPEGNILNKITLWTLTGWVNCNNNIYLATAWKEDYEKYYIAKINQIYLDNCTKINNSIVIPENKFGVVGLDCTPNIITYGKSTNAQNNLEKCVALIFVTNTKWPENELGEHIVKYDEEEFNNQFDTEVYEEEVTEDDNNIQTLFDEVGQYANSQPKDELVKRIMNNLYRFKKEEFLDFVCKLSEELSIDANEQEIQDNIDFLPYQKLYDIVEIFAKREPVATFQWQWYYLPINYLCTDCYEPVEKDQNICKYCNSLLEPINDEEILNVKE
jgi:hypothetical protein